MKIASIRYVPHLKTEAKHLNSGSELTTSAPKDNNGDGSDFSPTDMLSTSLAACMFTLMGIKAEAAGFKFHGAEADIEKLMASNPRKVQTIRIDFTIPDDYASAEKKVLEGAALNCPVAKSLHPDLNQEIRFHYLATD